MTDFDKETNIMSTIAKMLSELEDNESRSRVIRWLSEKFNVTLPMYLANSATEEPNLKKNSHETEPIFTEFIDLFDLINPANDVESVLTAGYWFQLIQNLPSWNSQQTNDILKDTGHGISNITRALDHAQEKTPALVRQIAKSGKSKQSRKTYKLTTSGLSFISKRIASQSIS